MSATVNTTDSRELADEIDRALVDDGLQEEWVVSDVMDILAERGVDAEPEDILVAFGVLERGGWWYKSGNGKLICTLKRTGPPTGAKPD